MPAAITLTLDHESSGHVRALWQVLADAGISTSMSALGYVPHVTVAVWSEGVADLSAPELSALVAIAPRTLAVGTFGAAAPGVLWLGVVTTKALLALQARAAAAHGGPLHHHYRQGAWVPHITLATDVPEGRMGEALDRVMRGLVPFVARVAAIEAVTFPPVRVAASQPVG